MSRLSHYKPEFSRLHALRHDYILTIIKAGHCGRKSQGVQTRSADPLVVHIDHDPPADFARKYFGRKSGNFLESGNDCQRIELIHR